jgi:hypothetical protein
MEQDGKEGRGRRRLLLRIAGVAAVTLPGCGGSLDLGDGDAGHGFTGSVVACGGSDCGTPEQDAGQSDAQAIGVLPYDGGHPSDGSMVGRVPEDAGPMGPLGVTPIEAGPMGPLGSAPADAGPTVEGGPVGLGVYDAGGAGPVGLGAYDAGSDDAAD